MDHHWSAIVWVLTIDASYEVQQASGVLRHVMVRPGSEVEVIDALRASCDLQRQNDVEKNLSLQVWGE